jgi:hypothetical protein
MFYDPIDDFHEDTYIIDDWAMHQLFTRAIFNAFVKAVVHGQYGFYEATHVTLHVDEGSAMLFVWEDGRASVLEDDALYDWVLGVIAADVLGLDPDAIDVIYLDGAVSSDDPYLYIKGDGILISTGQPVRKGNFL